MKVALISMRPKIANKQANMKTMESYIDKTSADMYVFGEICLTGYRCKDELRDLAEPVNGPSLSYLKKVAKAHQCYLVVGMPLLDKIVDGLIHNAAIFIHPNGKVDTYNKWFLPTFGPFEEKLFFDEGEQLPIVTTKFGNIGIIICYDLFFPELCKAYVLQGADFIICLSASPSTTRNYFEALLPARAIENTVFMIYVNLVGTQEDLTFWGGSQLYSPFGALLKKAPYFKESCITCELDVSDIQRARANRPVIRDIRPEIYQDLYHLSRHHKKSTKK